MTDTAPNDLEPLKQQNASYGALISIVLILAIIVVGAFYAWGKRIAENQTTPAAGNNATTSAQF